MEIPVTNLSRVYINNAKITLIINKGRAIEITEDGWRILKICDGTKNIEEIYSELNKKHNIGKEDLSEFLKESQRLDIIKFIDRYEKINYKMFDGKNKIFPQTFSVELTDRCNLECTYCYGSYLKNKGRYYEFENLKELFLTLAEKGVYTIELTGGEPLLHPKFKEILLLALSNFEKVNILSNGVLFNEEIFAIIKNNIDKISVQISIDGCSEETNCKIRQTKNSWKKSLNTLLKLQEYGIPYRVGYMITPENIHEIEDVCKLFEKENLKNIVFSLISTDFGRGENYKKFNFDVASISSLIEEMKTKYNKIFFKSSRVYDLSNRTDNCGIGWQHATISPYEIVKSCMLLDDKSKLGSLKKQSISDIFKSDKVLFYANFSKKFDEELCDGCPYNVSCGNCIARIYKSNIQRIKEGLGWCPYAKKINMNKIFDYVD